MFLGSGRIWTLKYNEETYIRNIYNIYMTLGYFSAGDSPFFFSEKLQQLSWLPNIWDSTTGFGRSTLVQLWIDYPIRLVIKLLHTIGFDWWSIDKILWGIPLVLAVVSVYKLSSLLLTSTWQRITAIVMYMTNTYVLMLFDGGQRGVLLAYSFAPVIFYNYIRLIDSYDMWISNKKTRLWHSVALSLLWGIFIAFDLRFAYLGIAGAVLYGIVDHIYRKISIGDAMGKIMWLYVLPLVGAGLLHAFWILPLGITHTSVSLGEEYTSAGMLKFLSVADFSHAFALLHPNWPENLFGKVYFLQPEFLLLPLIAFGSLLSISTRTKISNDKHILYFALLSLGGIFFAKGVVEPFGIFFSWMFDHIPGFVMFRDPTKFYLYITIGYSMLIPYTLHNIFGLILSATKKQSKHSHVLLSMLIICACIWLYMIRPIFLGTLTGNFKPKAVSVDYVRFKDVLLDDTTPSRVLWLPMPEKFAYTSDIHPALTAEKLFSTASISGLLTIIDSPSFQQSLDRAGVKYIVIPIDEWKRMFLKDYVYDQTQRQKLANALHNKGYIKSAGYEKLDVFTNSSFHFISTKPEYILKQEYFMRIGLVISGFALFTLCGILLKYRKK